MKSKSKKRKKGITPLLATVLLISFAISIAVLVWLWVGNLVKERAEKTGQEVDASLVCTTEIRFSVTDARCFDSQHINFKLENKGTSKIDDFRVILIGSVGTNVTTLAETLEVSEKKLTSVFFNPALVGNKPNVTLIPIIIRANTKTCKEKEVLFVPSNC